MLGSDRQWEGSGDRSKERVPFMVVTSRRGEEERRRAVSITVSKVEIALNTLEVAATTVASYMPSISTAVP